MKKTVLIVAVLSLMSIAVPMRVLAFPWGLEAKGGLQEGGYVSEIYCEVYGRTNLPQEGDKWKKAGFPNDEYLPENKQNQLRQILKAALREPGNPELLKLINRVYRHSFGHDAGANNEKYWTDEIVTKKNNWGYSEMMAAHRNFIRSEGGKWHLNYAIYAGYVDSIGRGPTDGEKTYWTNKIKKDGSLYTDLLIANAVYILGSSQGQAAEFRDTIKRAYKIVGLPEPSSDKIAQIRVKNKLTKRTFKQWQEYVKKFG